MELNNELIDLIKKWIKTDNEMRTLKQEVANRKKTKDKLSSELLTIMKSKDIDSFNINSGKIEYVQRKTKKPISKKLLQTILSKYYNCLLYTSDAADE